MTRLFDETLETLGSFDFDPLEKLRLAEQYDIPFTWAADAIASLASRQMDLTKDEMKSIEPSTLTIVLWFIAKASKVISSSSLTNARFTKVHVLAGLGYITEVARGICRRPILETAVLEPKPKNDPDSRVIDTDTSVSKHSSFYLSNEIVTVEVRGACLFSSRYSDSASKVDGEAFKFHAGLVVLHSLRLAAMLSLVEGSSDSPQSTSTEMRDITSTAFKHFLQWIYHE